MLNGNEKNMRSYFAVKHRGNYSYVKSQRAPANFFKKLKETQNKTKQHNKKKKLTTIKTTKMKIKKIISINNYVLYDAKRIEHDQSCHGNTLYKFYLLFLLLRFD